MKTKHAVIEILMLLFALEIAGCSPQPYTNYPDDYSNDFGEISSGNPYQQSGFSRFDQDTAQDFPMIDTLNCEEPFPIKDHLKPPMNIDDLPQAINPLLVNRKRVIGFTFTTGQVALMASPARARCTFDQSKNMAVLGVVWSWNQHNEFNKPAAHIVAIDTMGGKGDFAPGVLIPIDTAAIAPDQSGEMSRNIRPIQFKVSSLQAQKGASLFEIPPVDVSIRAESVCFRYDMMQFCSQGEPLLSPKSLFPDAYEKLVKQPIVEAKRRLLERTLDKKGEKDRGNRLLEWEEFDNVREELAISEIEQPQRIKECRPAEPRTCQADIIVAGIEPVGKISTDTPMNIGITVIKEKLYGFPSGEKDLQAGSYVIKADIEQKTPQGYNRRAQVQGNPDNYPQPLVTVSGITNSGEAITQRIPARLGSYIAENDEQGIVEICGPCFWCDWICGFWEKYKGY